MPLESGTYIDDFVTTNPLSTDSVAQGDDQMRWMKSASKATFPNATKEFYFPTYVAVAFADSPYSVPTTTGRNLLIKADATNGSITINLPAVASAKVGARISVVRADTTSNTVTLDGSGSETIGGAATFTLAKRVTGSANLSAVTLESSGAEWLIIGRNYNPDEYLPFTTAGDTLYRNATVPARLAIGTAGQINTVNAGATAPQWVSATSMLDTGIGSTSTRLLYRNASAWVQATLGTVFASQTNVTTPTSGSGSAMMLLTAGGAAERISLANIFTWACSQGLVTC